MKLVLGAVQGCPDRQLKCGCTGDVDRTEVSPEASKNTDFAIVPACKSTVEPEFELDKIVVLIVELPYLHRCLDQPQKRGCCHQ